MSATVDQLNQYLENGEFSLAMQAAQQVVGDQARDAALATIAAKQQAAGAQQAAVETLADIRRRHDSWAADRRRWRWRDWRPGGGFGGQGGGGFGGGGGGLGIGGGQGQQSQADFDTLIELITTTVDPDTWEEVGGQGTIAGFPGGVFVDAQGVLRKTKSQAWRPPRPAAAIQGENGQVTISLPRLEKALQLRRAAGLPPTTHMRTLGGLQRVSTIHVFPETGDVVLAGPPARHSSSSLRLEDLVVVATALARGDGKFGCSINPRQENLKRTQDFLTRSSGHPLKPGQRPRWLKQLADELGRQDIEVFGIPASTSTAQTLVYADYHMKLIGMGIEPGPAELASYLDRLTNYPGPLPPLDVLRWWFTANYDGVNVNDEQTVYQLQGQAVRVLSENELLDQLGQRVATGQSHPLNAEFAADFTSHFEQLADRHSFYARLRGIFDLALVAAIVFEDDLAGRVGWQPTLLVHDDGYLVPEVVAATEVDSVIGHRVAGGTKIIAGVSGGVSFDARQVLAAKRRTSNNYQLVESHRQSAPRDRRGRDEVWIW